MNIYRTEKEGDYIYQSDKAFPREEDYYSEGMMPSPSYVKHLRDCWKLESCAWFSCAKRIKVAESGKFRNHIWLSNGMEGIEEMKAEFTKHDKSLLEGVEIDDCFRVEKIRCCELKDKCYCKWATIQNMCSNIGKVEQAVFVEPTHERNNQI